jgi:hypothetical protein
MLEKLLVGLVVAVCAFFTGRRFYRQWQVAVNRDTASSCEASCCSCCPGSSPCDLHKDPPPAAKGWPPPDTMHHAGKSAPLSLDLKTDR